MFNKLAPAYFTTNVKQLFREELFTKDKAKLVFKLFLPSYSLLPICYYQRKQDINNIFAYDTREYTKEYADLFDENSNRNKKQQRYVSRL